MRLVLMKDDLDAGVARESNVFLAAVLPAGGCNECFGHRTGRRCSLPAGRLDIYHADVADEAPSQLVH